MRLSAHMIFVDYKSNDSISVLDEKNYKDGTKLGLDDKKYWLTYEHYRVEKSFNMYQLGFKIDELLEDEAGKSYIFKISTHEEDMDTSYILSYDAANDLYYDKSNLKNKGIENTPVGIDSSGTFYVHVFNEEGAQVYVSPPICVLPSSMTYEEYESMISDLLQINDNLVINKKAKVALKGNWEYRRDSIIECLDKIEGPLKRINMNPAISLQSEYVKERYRSNSKIKYKTLVEKALFPYKNKYTKQANSESSDIYENRLIKYKLKKLKDKVLLYKEAYQKDYNLQVDEINIIEKDLEKSGVKLRHLADIDMELLEQRQDLERINSYNNIICNAFLTDVEFTFNINRPLQDVNVSFDKNSCTIILKSSFNKEVKCDKFDLDVSGGSYRYKGPNESIWNSGRFEGTILRIEFNSTNLKEIYFLITKLVEPNNYINKRQVKLRAQSSWSGSQFKGVQNGMYKNYRINLCKIISIDDEDVSVDEDNDKIIDKLLLHSVKHNSSLENRAFVESLSNKNNLIQHKNQEFISNKVSWDYIVKKIDNLLSLGFFRDVKECPEIWKSTQIFSNNADYKNVKRNLKHIDESLSLLHDFDFTKFAVKSTRELYEYWCFFKMVDVLVSNMQWEIVNYDEFMSNLNKYLYENVSLSKIDLNVIMNHKLDGNNMINLQIYYNKEFKSNKDGNHFLRPDYTMVINKNGKKSIFYIDAKYRNYKEQSKNEWIRDLKAVSIDKYIKRFENTENSPVASFIVHPDSKEEYTFYGGYLESKLRNELSWNEPPGHKFGSFQLTPNNTIGFKTFVKMVLEYHLGLYDYCWNCGETEKSEGKIIKVQKQTSGGYPKYHYTCGNCGEFWVKNHCNNGGHPLIKHLYNYHESEKNKYPWFVKCPVCNDRNDY